MLNRIKCYKIPEFLGKMVAFRDADKLLWGKSFYDDLVKDIDNSFNRK